MFLLARIRKKLGLSPKDGREEKKNVKGERESVGYKREQLERRVCLGITSKWGEEGGEVNDEGEG